MGQNSALIYYSKLDLRANIPLVKKCRLIRTHWTRCQLADTIILVRLFEGITTQFYYKNRWIKVFLVLNFSYSTLGGIGLNEKSIQFIARQHYDKTKVKFIMMECRENEHINYLIFSEIMSEDESM